MSPLLRLLFLALVVAAVPGTDVGFTTTVASGGEATAATPITITVVRSTSTGPLTVNFTTSDTVSVPSQRAAVGSDYTIAPVLTAAPAGTLDFADGESSKNLVITVSQDAQVEGREYIRLTLTSGSYDIVGALSSVQVTIADDDLVATVFNDDSEASENPNVIGSPHDPSDGRRGLMRVGFSAESTFDKAVQAAFTGTATFTTDYALTYKIGGNALRDGFGFSVVGYPTGVTDIQVTGPNTAITGGSTVRFSDAPTTAYTVNAYGGGAGILTLSSALTHRLSLGATMSIDGMPSVTYTVAKVHGVGATQLAVTGGQGVSPALSRGDVFHFGGSARYVVTTSLTSAGVLEFRRYTGGNPATTGLDVAITTNTPIQTIFSATTNPLSVIIPAQSTRIEYGITPGGSGTANDGLVEGAEIVALALSTNSDYAFGATSTGAVTIADVDSTASIVLTGNAVEQDTPGTFAVSLTPPFTRAVDVEYTVSGNATAGTDYTTLSGVVRVPAGGSGVITVQPLGTSIPVGGRTVIVSLKESTSYVLADGVLSASAATLTILPTTGTVSLSATTDGTEGGSNAAFTLTLVRYSGHAEAVTVGYTLSGGSTATAGSDYTALSGTVTIPANQTTVTIPVNITDDALAEADETVGITLVAGSSYRLTGTVSGTVTLHDNEPIISVSASTNAVEGGAIGTFTLSYPAPARAAAFPITFVLSGTAVSPDDYTTTTPTTVTIPANTLTATVSITAVDNALAYTPSRQVILTITPPGASGTFHVGTNTRSLAITDNEPAVSVSAASGPGAIENGATSQFNLTVSAPAPTGGLTIPFTFSGVPAGDFTATPATQIVIAAGATTGSITITAADNAVVDAARTLAIALTPPPGAATYRLGTASASLALVDNDVGITNVTSPNSNGTYVLGDSISITVTFSSTVVVSGTPTLTLAAGAVPRQATYSSGSGTATLTLTYVVQANDASADLDYASTAALTGTISSGSVPAVLTLPPPGAANSLAANKALIIDGSLSGGKPAPGAVGDASGGGCGLGSGFATLLGLCMLAVFAVSVRRVRP